ECLHHKDTKADFRRGPPEGSPLCPLCLCGAVHLSKVQRVPDSTGTPQKMPSGPRATDANDFPNGYDLPPARGAGAGRSVLTWSFTWPVARSRIDTVVALPTTSHFPFAAMLVAPTRMSFSRLYGPFRSGTEIHSFLPDLPL